MSKKLNICINDSSRPNLTVLFHKYLSHKVEHKNYSSCNYAKLYDYYDNDYDDDYDVIYPYYGKKKKKKKNSYGRNRIIDISLPFDGEEESFVTDDYNSPYKEIWFYIDYRNRDDRLEFNSLKDFSDYCDDMGYYLGDDVIDDLTYRYESHCCLCPKSQNVGLLEVASGYSYGDMFYSVCDDKEPINI